MVLQLKIKHKHPIVFVLYGQSVGVRLKEQILKSLNMCLHSTNLCD